LNWPAEPVLKSDIKIDPVAVAKTLSEETGIAPANVVPDKVKRRRGDLTRTRTRPPEDPATARSVSRRSVTSSPFISPQNLTGFVAEYLTAMGSNDVKNELKFYADKVNYYHNGTIDRRIIDVGEQFQEGIGDDAVPFEVGAIRLGWLLVCLLGGSRG
jgi:hypothetical protein